MRVNVRDAVRRFAVQAIDVPEVGGVGPHTQNVVQAEPDIPSVADQVTHVAVPFAVAAALDLVVRRERLPAQVAILQATTPGAEILYVDVEGPGRDGGVGKKTPNVARAVVEVSLEAGVIARIAGIKFEPAQRLVSQVYFVAIAPARRTG